MSAPSCIGGATRASPTSRGSGVRGGATRPIPTPSCYDVLLAFAVARRWPDVRANALEPGWVPTKMGGAHATGDLDAAHRTQAWLAVSDDPAAAVTGQYFFHKRLRKPSGATVDTALQDRLMSECERLSGVPFPDGRDGARP